MTLTLTRCVCVLQDDYRRTVKELDEKEFVSIRLVVHELRNHYVSITLLPHPDAERLRTLKSHIGHL